MEVQSVINESALKEARKYLIKPGIRKISAIASAAFVLLHARLCFYSNGLAHQQRIKRFKLLMRL